MNYCATLDFSRPSIYAVSAHSRSADPYIVLPGAWDLGLMNPIEIVQHIRKIGDEVWANEDNPIKRALYTLSDDKSDIFIRAKSQDTLIEYSPYLNKVWIKDL